MPSGRSLTWVSPRRPISTSAQYRNAQTSRRLEPGTGRYRSGRGPRARAPAPAPRCVRSSPEDPEKEWNLRVSAPGTPVAGPPVAGVSAGFEGFERTSENRGVPGSSPGLAIDRSPMTKRFTAIRLRQAANPGTSFETKRPRKPLVVSCVSPRRPMGISRQSPACARHDSPGHPPELASR
jgi:hypothetical protein